MAARPDKLLSRKGALPSLRATAKSAVAPTRGIAPITKLEGSFLTAMSGAEKVSFKDRERLEAIATREEIALPLLTIKSIGLGVMSADVAEKFAVAEVTVPPEGYDKREVIGTPDDPRFGVLPNDEICSTCHLSNMTCPGHFGFIRLNEWFLHPMFAVDAVNLLQCFCNSCSRLLVPAKYISGNGLDRKFGRARWKELAEICVRARCPRVVGPGEKPCPPNVIYEPSKIADSHIVTYHTSSEGRGGKKTATEGPSSALVRKISDIYNIFKNVRDEDAKLVGFQNGMRPEHLILRVLPVLPPCARPYMYINGEKHVDHLTTVYRDEIGKVNAKLAVTTSISDHRNEERDLWFKISHLMDNHDGKLSSRASEPVAGIKQRMVRKEGVIRKQNMGKAVNFCARTVLGPMHELRFGEVGFPEIMRKGLTVPEGVHSRNIDYIHMLYESGEITSIIPGSGDVKGRRYVVNDTVKRLYKPMIGDTVERRLRGATPSPIPGVRDLLPDVVMFNRQPTLSKLSITGHEIVPVQRKTFGTHMGDTKAKNADFDGDEGNTHILQTIDAQVEARTFASIKSNMMSAMTNSPIVGIVYNGLSGCYLMTMPDAKEGDDDSDDLDEDEWEEAISVLTHTVDLDTLEERCARHGVRPRSGKALFSTLLPSDLWYERVEEISGKRKNRVIIRDGVLISGTITKSNIGVTGGTIHQLIWKSHGPSRAATFVTDCTYLTDWFIWNHGFSIGYGDLILPQDNHNEVRKTIDKSMIETRMKVESLGPAKFGSSIDAEFRERQISSWAASAAAGGMIIGNKMLSSSNPLNIMSDSGAKGNSGNTAQITGLMGQQFIKGKRPEMRMSSGTRVLPYFRPGDDDIKARGFCTKSLVTGMDPAELAFHAFGTRIGLTDTAVSTADVGYMHHRMVKVGEDVSVRYDGSVRNADDVLMMMSYGVGYDAAEMVNTKSSRGGKVVSFIDLASTIGMINQSYGYSGDVVSSRF